MSPTKGRSPGRLERIQELMGVEASTQCALAFDRFCRDRGYDLLDRHVSEELAENLPLFLLELWTGRKTAVPERLRLAQLIMHEESLHPEWSPTEAAQRCWEILRPRHSEVDHYGERCLRVNRYSSGCVHTLGRYLGLTSGYYGCWCNSRVRKRPAASIEEGILVNARVLNELSITMPC